MSSVNSKRPVRSKKPVNSKKLAATGPTRAQKRERASPRRGSAVTPVILVLRAAGTKLDMDVFRQRLATRQKSAG